MPEVSVLMPVYNTRPEHLREAMESILAQTFTDFEFLILNDASSDPRVEEVVQSFSDPRIVYAVNEKNLGISGSRNRLLDMAKGEYLAVMDHDDISLPGRLEKQVAFLKEHPDMGLVGCQFSTIGRDKISHLPLDDISLKKALMVHCGDMCHPATMLRREVLEKHHIRYEAMFSPSEDHALFCRMIPHTRFATLPEVLFCYRAWDGNTSHSQAKKWNPPRRACFPSPGARTPTSGPWPVPALWNAAVTASSAFPSSPASAPGGKRAGCFLNAFPCGRQRNACPASYDIRKDKSPRCPHPCRHGFTARISRKSAGLTAVPTPQQTEEAGYSLRNIRPLQDRSTTNALSQNDAKRLQKTVDIGFFRGTGQIHDKAEAFHGAVELFFSHAAYGSHVDHGVDGKNAYDRLAQIVRSAIQVKQGKVGARRADNIASLLQIRGEAQGGPMRFKGGAKRFPQGRPCSDDKNVHARFLSSDDRRRR